MAVPAGPVVKSLDLVKAICLRSIACFVDAPSDAFFLLTAEEGLGHRVDPCCCISETAASHHCRIMNPVPSAASHGFLDGDATLP